MDKRLSDAILVANAAGLTDGDLASIVEKAVDVRRAAKAAPGLVTMVHPSLPGEEHHVDPDGMEIYSRSGWTVKPPDDVPDEPNDEEPAEVDEATETTEETS